METKENALSAFSDETLNEMAMENLEGGAMLEGTANKSCPTTNNCSGGNCATGCGGGNIVTPVKLTEAPI